jgi:hypothetical protein
MSLVHDLIVGTLDASQYEDACRALLGTPLGWLHVCHTRDFFQQPLSGCLDW